MTGRLAFVFLSERVDVVRGSFLYRSFTFI